MRTDRLTFVFLPLLCFVTFGSFGQNFDIDAQIRPRFESRNGFRFLPQEGVDAANFISQRNRLILNFSQEKLRLRVSVNNHKVWGDIPSVGSDDVSISFYEAWGEALFTDKFSVRLGRQAISYDDQRIFGAVDWIQQGRSHDAMVAMWKFTPKNRLDIGVAYNSNGESLARTPYTMQYKALQYAWYHADMNKLGVSLLFLNNGVEYDQNGELEIDYTQTFGTRLTYKAGSFISDASFYYQTGKLNNTDVSASNLAINLKYKLTKEFLVGAGYEYLSGNDLGPGGYGDVDRTEINAFNPFYGTNHKFNGLMDNFYVGNWINTVGLNDLYFVLAYNKNKFKASISPHFFTANGDTGDFDNKLGTEVDMTIGYKIAKNISFSAGYSILSAKDAMVALQGGNREDSGNWAFVQMAFNPKLFSYKKNQADK